MHCQSAFINSNVINSADVYGRLARKGNLGPIAGNWVINPICTASCYGCSRSPPSYMLYLFGPETLDFYTIFLEKIIPSKLDACTINEMFNFNPMKNVGIDTTHGVFH